MNTKTFLRLEFGHTVKQYITQVVSQFLSFDEQTETIDLLYNQFKYIWKHSERVRSGNDDVINFTSHIFEGNDFCLNVSNYIGKNYYFDRTCKCYKFTFSETDEFKFTKHDQHKIEMLVCKLRLNTAMCEFYNLFKYFDINNFIYQYDILNLIKKIDGKIYNYKTSVELSKQQLMHYEYIYNYIYLNVINAQPDDFAFINAPIELKFSHSADERIFKSEQIIKPKSFLIYDHKSFTDYVLNSTTKQINSKNEKKADKSVKKQE